MICNKKPIIKDVKKECKNREVIKKIKASNDFEEIAFILYDAKLGRIVDRHYSPLEREHYFEKWLDKRSD